MSKESLVVLIGMLVAITPWLGVPREWRVYALTAFGVLLVVLGYLLRRTAYLRRIERADGDRGTDVFVEGRPQSESDVITQ